MKNILITGGARGLGRATAEKLARSGNAVILTARDEAAGARAVAEIRAAAPKGTVEMRLLDLASLSSVRRFARDMMAEGRSLDVLINNAGVMQQSPVRRVTVDGFEETMGVNVMAPFLLTSLLAPLLGVGRLARVVNVTSRLHLPGSRGVPVNFDAADPQLEHGYHPERAYKNSKLAMLWFTYELDRRARGSLHANAVCPGFVPVTAAASTHGMQRLLLEHVLPHMPFARSVDEASDSFVFMATDPSLDGLGGRFYAEMRPLASSPESMDAERAAWFWEYCSKATAVADGRGESAGMARSPAQ